MDVFERALRGLLSGSAADPLQVLGDLAGGGLFVVQGALKTLQSECREHQQPRDACRYQPGHKGKVNTGKVSARSRIVTGVVRAPNCGVSTLGRVTVGSPSTGRGAAGPSGAEQRDSKKPAAQKRAVKNGKNGKNAKKWDEETHTGLVRRARRMNRTLAIAFPRVYCELDFTNPLELTVATILSAQSTDKRVNLTTPALFKKYRTALDYAQADRAELEELIRPTGFYRNKANSLIRLGQELVERFDGEVPRTMVQLVTLPGVGRKTANVILGNAFDIPGITVDTHFGRLVRRWRWTAEEDPVKVEHAVGELIERSQWTLLSHRVIFHGRRVCHARKPACGVCVLAKDCPSYGLGPTEPLIAASLVKGPETAHLLALAGL